MARSAALALALFALMSGGAAGQAGSGQLRFEVASIKPIRLDSDNSRKLQIDPALVTLSYVSLTGVVVLAYGSSGTQYVKPDWFDEQIYEIVAKPPAGSRREQIPAMLQNLLADRFQMKVHWETRVTNGYVLVIGKAGLKLSPVADEEKSEFSFSTGGHVECLATSFATFADRLTGCCFRQRPVVNQTGVEGKFDFVLDFTKEDLGDIRQDMGIRTNTNATTDGKPSIFTAIRGLGLELKPAKVPIQYLVVDSCLKTPTPN